MESYGLEGGLGPPHKRRKRQLNNQAVRESPEIVTTDQRPQPNTEIPESDANDQQPNDITTPTAGQEGTTGVEPEVVDEWANLAGDARRKDG